MIVYRCEDSPESIFTAIYNAYEEKRNHQDTYISLQEEYFLFAEYVSVVVDMEKVCKVTRTLENRFGAEDYGQLWQALCSCDTEKGQAVYQTVVAGLAGGKAYGSCPKGHLFDKLADDNVRKAFELSRAVGNEICHLKGFVRFQELQNGVLFSEIGPKNNVMSFLMPHFADRFPMENFMIYDTRRSLYGIHAAGKQWYLVQGEDGGGNALPRSERQDGWTLSERELAYQELFRYFCRKIAITERENPNLQRSLLPLRFRGYMTEFQTNPQA